MLIMYNLHAFFWFKKYFSYCTFQDFNDHAPQFVVPSSNFTIKMKENATIGII